jgi:hypothetical protein
MTVLPVPLDEPPVMGTFTTQHPFPARLDLGALS